MAPDWDKSETEVKSPPPPGQKKPVKSKWEGEDDNEDDPVSDWEASSESEEEKPLPAVTAAPPKKKGTLKAKLAEKEASKASKAAIKADADNEEYDSDEVLDPREKARRDKERELAADLAAAKELLGTASIGGSKELDALLSFEPRKKEDFQILSSKITDVIIKRHQSNPLYPIFVEHHVRELAMTLKDVEVRKAASALTTLANEKQKEQRDKASGKKKAKASVKPVLGSAKVASRLDTSAYNEALDDDFGAGPDDFM